MHGPGGRLQATTTAVLERFTRRQQWLVADHGEAFDLFGVTVGIDDHPMA